jgi:hypothetical protein
MIYLEEANFLYVNRKKENSLTLHWLWSVFVFSRLIIKERCQGIVVSTYSQKKSLQSASGFRSFVLKGYHRQEAKRYQNSL